MAMVSSPSSSSSSGSATPSPNSGTHRDPHHVYHHQQRDHLNIQHRQQPSSVISSPSPSTSNRYGDEDEKPPLFLGFNQDCSRLACGTEKGFRVYVISGPSAVKECENFEASIGAGISTVELMYDRGFAAIVGGGQNPKFPPHKVMMWDFNQCRCTGELSFRSPVRAVKLRFDKLVVVLEQKFFVYEFETLGLLFVAETIANPKGLCALSGSPSSPFVFACAGSQKGEVRIEQLRPSPEKKILRDTNMIAAHDSHLACIALSTDGRLLATASNKGTLIRVFSTFDGTHLQEVRRGAERAEIYSISFSWNAHWLAVSSDKGTVHVFGLHTGISRVSRSGGTINANPGSTLSFMKGVLPKYFSSEWSFAQFRLPEEIKSIVAFAPEKHSIFIVGSDGSFSKCSFDPVHGGEMVQKEYIRFLKLRNDIF